MEKLNFEYFTGTVETLLSFHIWKTFCSKPVGEGIGERKGKNTTAKHHSFFSCLGRREILGQQLYHFVNIKRMRSVREYQTVASL